MTIQELIEKRAKAWDNARDFLDSKRNSSGLLSEEDSKTYDKLEAEIVALGKEINRLENLSALGDKLNAPTSNPILSKPNATTGRASDEYKTAMLTALRTNFKQISNVLQEGVDADGGYLVPIEYDRRLIDVLEEEN
ncbi:MAG: phage major capsid protein, partial [Ruminococcus sp.]|nr:phage major capsid protein [Ruminococcus sp.]